MKRIFNLIVIYGKETILWNTTGLRPNIVLYLKVLFIAWIHSLRGMNSTAVVQATAAVRLPVIRFRSTGNRCVAAGVADNFAVDCRNLSYSVKTKQGRTVPILNDCSLSIPSGEFWMLLGPNGCGKSTLLKVCNILHVPVFFAIFSFI